MDLVFLSLLVVSFALAGGLIALCARV